LTLLGVRPRHRRYRFAVKLPEHGAACVSKSMRHSVSRFGSVSAISGQCQQFRASVSNFHSNSRFGR
jgi:hypothetical protein